MPIELYYTPGSAPCRGVLLTGAALDIDFDLKELNLLAGEHLTGDLVKINPTHTVPTIKDENFVLWESRAIIVYLAQKYDKKTDLNLCPQDPTTQALINKMLYFDMGTLYDSFATYYYPALFYGKNFDPENLKGIQKAFEFFNTMLKELDKPGKNELYAAACWLTVADLSLAASVSTFIACDFDITPYPYVSKWYNTIKKLPYFEKSNTIPLKKFELYYQNAKKRLA